MNFKLSIFDEKIKFETCNVIARIGDKFLGYTQVHGSGFKVNSPLRGKVTHIDKAPTILSQGRPA